MKTNNDPVANTRRRMRLWEMYARRFCRRHMPPGWFEARWERLMAAGLINLTMDTVRVQRREHPACNN